MKMRTFLSVILLVVLSGCVTKKACNRKFQSQGKDSVREVFNTMTVYRDTTIFIRIPGDTFYLETSANLEQINTLTTSYCISRAWIQDGMLKHSLVQKDTLIPEIVENGVKSTITSVEKERYHIADENDALTWWQKLQMHAGRYMIYAIIMFLILLLANNLKGLIK